MNDWTWHWIGYTGNANFGDNPFFDWVRVLLLVIAGFLVLMIVRIIIDQTRRRVGLGIHQLFGFTFSIIATLSIANTEIDLFGTVATPRLIINTAALLCGMVAMHLTHRHQRSLAMKSADHEPPLET